MILIEIETIEVEIIRGNNLTYSFHSVNICWVYQLNLN